RMTEVLRHESFYTVQTFVDRSLGVYAAAIARRRSFSDGMPLWNERHDVALMLSGEDYPKPGTIEQLRAAGHDVQAEGPSYLVHLYEEDTKFPAGLNGRFHGLAMDQRRGTATLFNDRY